MMWRQVPSDTSACPSLLNIDLTSSDGPVADGVKFLGPRDMEVRFEVLAKQLKSAPDLRAV